MIGSGTRNAVFDWDGERGESLEHSARDAVNSIRYGAPYLTVRLRAGSQRLVMMMTLDGRKEAERLRRRIRRNHSKMARKGRKDDRAPPMASTR